MEVSLIVPVYNVKDYLAAFMDSVLAQTYRDFEVLLVNDCSTDGSGAICDAYAKQYPFCRALHHETNKGAGEARNTALRQAKGEFITFADPDDVLRSDYLEALIHTQETLCCDMVIGNYVKEYIKDGAVVKTRAHNKCPQQTSHDTLSVLCSLYTHGMLFYGCGKLLRRDIIREFDITFPSVFRMEDLQFNFEYYRHISTIGVADQPIYFYRHYLCGRVTANAGFHDTRQTYDIAVSVLNKGLVLAQTFEDRNGNARQIEMLRQLVRSHYLQYTYSTVMDLSRSTQSDADKKALIRFISSDYRKRQKGRKLWNSGRKTDNGFHFLLMHQWNAVLWQLVKLRKKRKQREAGANEKHRQKS